MANDPRGIATTYFTAWKAQDFDTLRSILHIENGKITRVRVTFDPRDIIGAS